jgi:hypothetical protein
MNNSDEKETEHQLSEEISCGFCGRGTKSYLGFDSGHDWGYCDDCKKRHDLEREQRLTDRGEGEG